MARLLGGQPAAYWALPFRERHNFHSPGSRDMSYIGLEIETGLPWVDEVFNAHLRTTTRERRRALLEEAERRTTPEDDAMWERTLREEQP